MDFIERRVIEISKLNAELLKEESIKEEESKRTININVNLLEKVQSKINFLNK